MKLRTYLTVISTILLALTGVSYTQADGQADQAFWIGEYYNNTARTGSPILTRVDTDINFNWGDGAPAPQMTVNNFSAEWTSTVTLSSGLYRFWVLADDQVRVTVDGRQVINTFDSNIVDELVTGDIVLTGATYTIRIEYREYTGPAFLYLDFANLSIGESGPDFETLNTPESVATGNWIARYYANPNLSGNPAAIISQSQVGGNWGDNAPIASLPTDQWSARWETTLSLSGGTYRIQANADDGVRVYIDGVRVIDEWHGATNQTYTASRTITEGLHNVVVEYYDATQRAFLNFDIVRDNTTPASSTNTVTIATGRLNVRDAPNPFTGNILTKVSEGDVYPVIGRNDTGSWVQINVNGTIGWVNSSYVSYNNVASLPVQSVNPAPNNPVVTNTQYTVTATPFTVNVRTGPGTEFDDIANFNAEDTAQVIGRNNAGTWWQINYDGITGWVSARYARIEAGAQLENIPVTR